MVNNITKTFLSFSVPEPMIDISLSWAEDNMFLAGNPLTIACDVDVHDQVDTPIHVDIEWTMSGSPLTSNDRITVSGVDEIGINQYRSQVSFSTLSSKHDSGIYNCTVNVTSDEGCVYVEDADVVEDITALNVVSELIF